jgi:BASS family bile acid:Na+ symporter
MSLAAVPAVFSAFIQTLVGSVIATWWRLHPLEESSEGENG